MTGERRMGKISPTLATLETLRTESQGLNQESLRKSSEDREVTQERVMKVKWDGRGSEVLHKELAELIWPRYD